MRRLRYHIRVCPISTPNRDKLSSGPSHWCYSMMASPLQHRKLSRASRSLLRLVSHAIGAGSACDSAHVIDDISRKCANLGFPIDIHSMIKETKKFALTSRREIPTPMDFEKMLDRHNVPIASLKQHLKPPIPKTVIDPSYDYVPQASEDVLASLPLLGPELSGEADKDTKPYIPASFPDFPSKHTYKFTPQEDVNVRDSKSVREQVARTAQQGEDALRRLVRASKIRKQKEVKTIVEKDRHGKERFRLWEQTMKHFMVAEVRGEATDQLEIADHSMIVNSGTVHHRKELARLGKRNLAVANGSGRL